MKRFSFNHFPTENEIIDDATTALRLQLEGGAGQEIATMVIQRIMDPNGGYTNEEFNEFLETDSIGMKCLFRLNDPGCKLSDMTEEEREMTALLWVNYMCDQPYGQIIASMHRFIETGVDYRKHAIDIIALMEKKKEIDESVYNGTIIYLWTMINVARNIRKSIPGILNAPSPHIYRGLSLN